MILAGSQDIPVKIGSKNWIHGFSSLEKYISSATDESIAVFLNGTDFARNFSWNSEWKKPVKIIQKGGLGMRVPNPGFDIQDLELFTTDEQTTNVVDIYNQKITEMKLKTFFDKWKKSRRKIFNILNWNLSGSP